MIKRFALVFVPILALCAMAFVSTSAQTDAGTTVLVAQSDDLGPYLTDAEGMTLYLFTNDTEGTSNCNDDCAANWPPFLAEEPLTLPDGVDGELTLISRADGSQQVAYNGIPLYYWASDTEPGQTTGHEVGDVWFVVTPDGPAGTPSASPVASPEGTPVY